ncbi:hypothetical protein niasHT_011989 [Heterodera trifolii]|uniref:Uncharacterized protein n=1 Tax=Heterodera trifolii TaxID=157864 RepID=A0ABD2L341_9BILA
MLGKRQFFLNNHVIILFTLIKMLDTILTKPYIKVPVSPQNPDMQEDVLSGVGLGMSFGAFGGGPLGLVILGFAGGYYGAFKNTQYENCQTLIRGCICNKATCVLNADERCLL